MSTVKYPPANRFPFRAGHTPAGREAGDHGPRRVLWRRGVRRHDRHANPLAWLHCKRGRHKGLMPILFAGLVRAVVEEDEVVVAGCWGVTRYMVNEWKRALAGCEDSNAVFTALAIKRADADFRKKYGYPT